MNPHFLAITNHSGLCQRRNVLFPDFYYNVWRGCLVGGGAVPGPRYYLAVQPTNRRLRLPASIACHKYINPKCKCWINLIIHTNGIHKVNSIILNSPFFYLV